MSWHLNKLRFPERSVSENTVIKRLEYFRHYFLQSLSSAYDVAFQTYRHQTVGNVLNRSKSLRGRGCVILRTAHLIHARKTLNRSYFIMLKCDGITTISV